MVTKEILKKGLSSSEAQKQILRHGTNEIKDIGKVSPLTILFRQVKSNFIVYLLFFAMVISFFVGKAITGYVILVVILVVIITGFIQEYKAEKAIEKLKTMVMPVSIVMRDGKETEILTKEIVPEDIVILRTGEKIPADCIILYDKDLLVNEAILTGEATEVKKTSAKDLHKTKPENHLFAGSFIVNGKCIAKVIHTGMNTKFGKIAGMISKAEKELPLQKKVNTISKYMAAIGVVMALLTGVAILFQSTISEIVLIEVLILVIAICVSAFPEGFPVVLITTLSVGTYRMAQKNAIVNRMSIIESLGETTVICSDKTGTITKGEMTARKILLGKRLIEVSGVGYEGHGEFKLDNKKIEPTKNNNLNLLLKASVLCNDAIIKRTGEDHLFSLIGTPTEGALLVMGAKAEIFKEDLQIDRIDEVPFSSERKMMTILCKEGKKKIVYSKGALEFLLKKCTHFQEEGQKFRLLERDRKRILEENKKMTSNAFRTIAFAYKEESSGKREKFEENLIFLGIVGIEDPPREGIKDALVACRKAGISTKMITGDSKETAISIAKQIELGEGKILEGEELEKLTDNELKKIVKEIMIFARVKPEHKLRIVKALKENGEIVTMTGDGVNDAPALKEAHIGVAMGKNGTDVSRSVADLTLKDDNFVTLVDAIKEGRTIFNNIQKFVTYQLSCNYAELFILFLGVLLVPFFGWPVPILLALHILFMNLVTADIPGITLGLNRSSEDIMNEKPRKNAEILNKNLFLWLALAGTLMAVFTLGVFYFAFNFLGQDASDARTTALLALIVLEIGGAFNFRSFRKTTFGRSPFVNLPLVYASGISILATILIIYTPVNRIFETVPIPLIDWAIAFVATILFVLILDIVKRLSNKGYYKSLEKFK